MKIYPFFLLLACVCFPAFAQQGEGEDAFSTTIRGNQELPEIVYIVPWATPPGPGQVDPLVPHSGNVFQRSFTPVERLEVRRQIRYHSEARAKKIR